MKIMVGYDGSNEAKDALKLAQKHAKAFGAKIEVVKSVTRNHPLDHSLIQTAEEKLEWEIRHRFNGNNINYETHLLVSSNSTGKNLVRFAELENIDEIIIGTHGLIIENGFNKGLLLPQVATEYNWDKNTFLEHTCRKAGLPEDS